MSQNFSHDVSQSPADSDLEREIAEALGDQSVEDLMAEAAPQSPPTPAGASADAPATGKGGDDQPQHFTAELARGRISVIRGEEVFVDLTGFDSKHQGIVPLNQFERPPRIGSIMDFVIQRLDEAEGLVVLSREGAVARATWDNIQRGAIVEARVVSTNKGGLEMELVGSIRAFMPASQVDLHYVEDLASYVGQKLTGVVQEVDRRGRKVVLSRRRHLEQQREIAKRKIWDSLEVGATIEGKVTSVAPYGAFVDVGGVDGLVHVSDMSYTRVDKPQDVVQVGQTVTVKVLKLDHEQERISLGLKQVQPDPWDGVADRYHAGEQVSGRVTRTADFGAFVEVEPGIEALLPVSEMSWKHIHRPSEVVNEGDVVRVAVLQVDPQKRRMSLSLKQATGDPWIGAEHKYAARSLVDATVRSITDFGAFVELEAGVEGLVHISELSDRRVGAVQDVLTVGDRKQFRVLDIDEEQRRVRLSLKAVAEPAPQSRPAEAHKPAATTAQKRQRDRNLKSGLGENGALGMGLGDLKL